MKILLIGGTGTISGAITARLAAAGHEVWLVNRNRRAHLLPPGVKVLTADVADESAIAALTAGAEYDCVADFIAFVPEHLQRDYRLFRGRARQFVFISSASAYAKPVESFPITEATPLGNPFWEYSRNKQRCEEYLRSLPPDGSFPVTIVRPSHTYCDRSAPVGVHGAKGSWQVLQRMLDGRPVVIHGDGTSLWTMTHSDDFAAGFCGLVGNPAALGETVNLTGDEARAWQYIYEAIAAALGVPLKPVYVASAALAAAGPQYDLRGSLLGDKANCTFFDNAKLKRLVPGFAAKVTMREGLSRAARYMAAHPECQTPDPEFDAWCDRVIAAAGY